LLCGLIIITGHLGGSLTHGSGYLTQSLFAEENETAAKRKPLPNVQEAMVYQEVVQPLLQSKCYGCHNANKKKGGLQMDKPDLLMKGGKDGKIIIAGKAAESEMIKRLLLPREHEDHMPPKEKPQPSEQEIALLHWWIASGAPFDKKVKDLAQPEKIKPLLLALEADVEVVIVQSDIPEATVEKADEEALKKLRALGVVVLPVAQNSNYLMANFITAQQASNADMQLLMPIRKQLIWLKLGGTNIGDSALAPISQCNKLMRLQLEHTAITDAGLASLKSLHDLRYLNLVGTKITANGLQQLKDLKKLQSIYLYHTNVGKSDWPLLQKLFPETHIDSGGYKVPILESDTTEVKYVPKK
jgi:mono/diheme cytochrome c family protein